MMMESTVSSKIIIAESIDDLAEKFSKYLKELVDTSPEYLNICLSGGSTPKIIFQHLAENYKTKFDWNKIRFFWGDERCVPPNNAESNYRMTKENLFEKINIPAENIFRIRGEENPDDEVNRYSTIIQETVPLVNSLPKFDLVILGIGEDGHTTSIFPDRLDLFETEKFCEVIEHPVSKQKRISLTGKVINNAKQIIFLVTGKNKSDIVKSILNKEDGYKKYPAAHISPINGELIWMLDKEAAQNLFLK